MILHARSPWKACPVASLYIFEKATKSNVHCHFNMRISIASLANIIKLA